MSFSRNIEIFSTSTISMVSCHNFHVSMACGPLLLFVFLLILGEEKHLFKKNTLAKSIENHINNKVIDKENGSLEKNSIFVLYRHCFQSWHLIFHVNKENTSYSRVRQRSMLNVLLGIGQTQFNKKRIDPLS